MSHSRRRPAFIVISLGIATVCFVLAWVVASKRYTAVTSARGVETVTSDARALEIARAMDLIRSGGWSDGRGNRAPGGDRLRAEVQQRRRTKFALYVGGTAALLVGVGLTVASMSKTRPHTSTSDTVAG